MKKKNMQNLALERMLCAKHFDIFLYDQGVI